MVKKIIRTERAPQAIGPYSQAVRIGNLLFISGQIPLDRSGRIVEGGIRVQTQRVMENIRAIVEGAGGRMDDIVKTTVYLKDMDDFQDFNEVYGEFFPEDPPARATVEVSNLPKGVGIEIEAIAWIPSGRDRSWRS